MKLSHGYLFPDYELHFIDYLSKMSGEYLAIQRNFALRIVNFLNFKKELAIDIGANVGLWARPLSAQYNRVMCFEPHPDNFDCLKMNVDENIVDCVQCALGEKQSTELLLLSNSAHNCGAASFVDFSNLADSERQEIEVLVRPLDDFNTSGVSFIKIDVQGYEEKVLLGAQRTLSDNPSVLVVENFPKRHSIVDLLDSFGYCLVAELGKENYFVPSEFAWIASDFIKENSRREHRSLTC